MRSKNKTKDKDAFEDDGRVIASMEGVTNPYKLIPTLPDKPKRFRENGKKHEKADITREEERQIRRGIMAASLLVGIVISGIFLLFILFCVCIWFK